jgi:1,4-dihydroxy-2-naphthoyl-CoA synthase
MANPNDYKFDYFNVTFPADYVAHVEINRPEKMNAFIEQYVLLSHCLGFFYIRLTISLLV